MRANEIYKRLTDAEIPGKSFPNYFTSDYQITFISELRNRLERVRGIPGFQDTDDQISKTIIFRTDSEVVKLSEGEWNQAFSLLATYYNQLVGLSRFLKATTKPDAQDDVFVKLPPTDDFNAVIAYQTQIAKALEQVVVPEGGELKIMSWEPGSLWLELAVGGQAMVMIVGSIAWSAAVIYKKAQEGRMFHQHAKSLELKNESLQNLVEAQDRMLALLGTRRSD